MATAFTDDWKNSNDWLFGTRVNKYSLDRAKQIRECETHGRNYNIYSYVDNKVDFKVDVASNL